MTPDEIHDAVVNTQAAVVAQIRELKEEHEIVPISWIEDVLKREMETLEEILCPES